MEDIHEFLLPYRNEENPTNTLRESLERAGFKVKFCEEQDKIFTFYSDQATEST